MNENTDGVEMTPAGDPIVGKLENGLDVGLASFGKGQFEGLKYKYPIVKSGEEADKVFGTDGVAQLINSAIKIRMANKAKALLAPSDADASAITESIRAVAASSKDGIDGLIIGSAELETWKLGERSPGTKAQIDIEFKKAQDAISSGSLTPEQANEMLLRLVALNAKRSKK